MFSIFQGAPSDFLCKKREQAPKVICRYQTKTEHFKSICALASDFPCSLAWSASARNERSHLVLLSLHTVWREELSLSLLLVIVMSLESHQIGVNQFVFVLALWGIPLSFGLEKWAEMEKEEMLSYGGSTSSTATPIYRWWPPCSPPPMWRWKRHSEEKGTCFLQLWHKAVSMQPPLQTSIILEVPTSIFLLMFLPFFDSAPHKGLSDCPQSICPHFYILQI